MGLEIEPSASKEVVMDQVEKYLGDLSLVVASVDRTRPWGGSFVIANGSIDPFIATYFPDKSSNEITKHGKMLSPKILVVAPHQELSWQYHHRRAEIWRVIAGPVGTVVSDTDDLTPVRSLNSGEIIEHDKEVRHRLGGLGGWGILAEIWQHTDPGNPSDEEDIVRLRDSYGRAS